MSTFRLPWAYGCGKRPPCGFAGWISERLQSLARARQTAVADIVHAAIDALERQEFRRGLSGDYQRLRSDPELWERYLVERGERDDLA